MRSTPDPHAEQIAQTVLESFSAPYFVLEPSQIEARKKVIRGAAKAVEGLLEAVRREAVEDAARGGT